MKKVFFALLLTSFLWMNFVPVAFAENTTLVPCKESPAFVERMQNAPDNYYTTKPFQAYSRLLCGDDGLPHLVLDRLNLAFDVMAPITMFLYIAGWIGWSGRSYLIAIRKEGAGEEKELFIDIRLFLSCMIKALMWPILAIKEFLSGELVAKDDEIPISIR
ncbi:MAG: Photosystem I reaction center subunit III [Richelia sp. RM2_1_2]|nr:Photosystem I reaction center subunit III [Richelia sp. SM1_7_0]NJN07431.1 Photosystem I reaction center subunit III [Richelia sp. RM1_1_1]NJO26770.1 Photosystem I reaction center subunit III [Richelia sp. SL_2_1]NJO57443.1 Photosystem I reaction center subunit III [Richelia sp. RM2_1_2]